MRNFILITAATLMSVPIFAGAEFAVSVEGFDFSKLNTPELAAEALRVEAMPQKKDTPESYGVRVLRERLKALMAPSDRADAGETDENVELLPNTRSAGENAAGSERDSRFTATPADERETDTEDKHGKYPYVECQAQLVRAKGGFEYEAEPQILELTEKGVDPLSQKDIVLGKMTIDFPSLIDLAKEASPNDLPDNDPRILDPNGGSRYSIDLNFRLVRDRSNFIENGDRLEIQTRFYNRDTKEVLGFDESHSDRVYTITMLKEVMQNTQFPFIGGVQSSGLYDKVMQLEDEAVQLAFKLGGIDPAATLAAERKHVSPYEAQRVNLACFTKVRKEPLTHEFRSGNTIFIFGKELPIKWDEFDFEKIDFEDLFRRAFKD